MMEAINKEGAAAIYGLFENMLQDIPNYKRERHYKKLLWLEKINFLPKVDLSDG